ncbi:hypothetical protein TELCIR_02327 [Teladorsagia circumcincta]|uniref:Uncharacterized protein n=1 Tax=Teladorsagia circumcincta TaxID=45464 RepID=A0A2G9V1I5_TELCI|nr:hypothetical protein TELCIR_02327 [Teladorsagia circumcincta]
MHVEDQAQIEFLSCRQAIHSAGNGEMLPGLFENTSFYPLNQAQLIEDDTSDFADESPGTSIDFMVAPVQMTNPLFNFISKAGQLYRYLRSGKQ